MLKRKSYPLKILNILIILCLLLSSEGIFQAVSHSLYAGDSGGFLEGDLVAEKIKKEAAWASDEFQKSLKAYESEFVGPLQEATDALRIDGVTDRTAKLTAIKSALENLKSPAAQAKWLIIQTAKTNLDSISTSSEDFATEKGSQIADEISRLKEINNISLGELAKRIDFASQACKGLSDTVKNNATNESKDNSTEYISGTDSQNGTTMTSVSGGLKPEDSAFEPTFAGGGGVDPAAAKAAFKETEAPGFMEFAKSAMKWDSNEGTKDGIADMKAEKAIAWLCKWGALILTIVLTIVTGGAYALAIAIVGAVIAGLIAFYRSYVVEENSLKQALITGILTGAAAFLMGRLASKLNAAGGMIEKLQTRMIGLFTKGFGKVMSDVAIGTLASGLSSFIVMGTASLTVSAAKGFLSGWLVNNNITAGEASARANASIEAFRSAGGEGKLAALKAQLAGASGEVKKRIQAEITRMETLKGEASKAQAEYKTNSDGLYYINSGGLKKDAAFAALGGGMAAFSSSVSYMKHAREVKINIAQRVKVMNPTTVKTDKLLADNMNKQFKISHQNGMSTTYRTAPGYKFTSPNTGKPYSGFVSHAAIEKDLVRTALRNPGLMKSINKSMKDELGEALTARQEFITNAGSTIARKGKRAMMKRYFKNVQGQLRTGAGKLGETETQEEVIVPYLNQTINGGSGN